MTDRVCNFVVVKTIPGHSVRVHEGTMLKFKGKVLERKYRMRRDGKRGGGGQMVHLPDRKKKVLWNGIVPVALRIIGWTVEPTETGSNS